MNVLARTALVGGLLLLPGCIYSVPSMPSYVPPGAPSPVPSWKVPAAMCPLAEPSARPLPGTKQHGRYEGQDLPPAWQDLPDEQAVTRAIKELEGSTEWPCFLKFHHGASALYHIIKEEK